MSSSIIPPNALPVWTDRRQLYTAMPGPDKLLFTVRYHYSTTGLEQMLGLIGTHAYDPRDPMLGRAYGDPTFHAKSDPKLMAAAERVLKSMKMLP